MGLFSLFGDIIGGNKAKKAATAAGNTINAAAQAGITESARQFDATRTDFAPYRELGAKSLTGFGNIAGLNGDDAQSSALAALRASPFYQMLYSSGEEAILANGSATGGLRGGNMQSSLARFGSDTFATAIDRELAILGGGIGIGQDAVGSTGSFGAQSVADQNALRFGGAEAVAQGQLTSGGIAAQQWQNGGAFLDRAAGKVAGSFGGGGLNFRKLF